MITGNYSSFYTVPEKSEKRIHVMFNDHERFCDIIGTGEGTILVEYKKSHKPVKTINAEEFMELLKKLNGNRN